KARTDLVAVLAFDAELERAPTIAVNPFAGEMRLLWWREAAGEICDGAAPRAHPTLQALAHAIHRRQLDRSGLEALADPRIAALQGADGAECTLEAGAAAGRLASLVLDPHSPIEPAAAAQAAWALSRIEQGPKLAAAFAAAQKLAPLASAAAFPAVAPAALVRARLAGRRASGLEKRLRLLAAVLSGRI
ncbi:MAG: squalene/phytoene synthase family protein, partial [Caulobacteraceae bacterium]